MGLAGVKFSTLGTSKMSTTDSNDVSIAHIVDLTPITMTTAHEYLE